MPYHTTARIERVSLHESRHAGALFHYDIPVHHVCIDDNGSGQTTFTALDPLRLKAHYKRDSAGALELILGYMSSAYAGAVDSPDALNAVDTGLIAEARALWEWVTSRPAGPSLEKLAHAQALCWVHAHQAAIQSFSRQLAYRRTLSGADLQRRLTTTFPRAEAASRPAPRHTDHWQTPQRPVAAPPLYIPVPVRDWRTGGGAAISRRVRISTRSVPESRRHR